MAHKISDTQKSKTPSINEEMLNNLITALSAGVAGQQQDKSKTVQEQPSNLLDKSIDVARLDPLEQAGIKTIIKLQNTQLEEAHAQGVPANQLAEQLISTPSIGDSQVPELNQALAGQQSQQPQVPQSKTNLLQTLKGLIQSTIDIIPTSPSAKIANSQAILNRQKLRGGSVEERRLSLSQERLDFERQEEVRRVKGEKRRQIGQIANNVDSFGRALDTDNPIDIAAIESLGLDLDNLQSLGKAERKPNGRIFIKSKSARDRIESQKTVPESVQKAISEFKDTRDILRDSIEEFKNLDLDSAIQDRNLIEQLFSPAGPLSISAKNNLLRQFQNPRVAALYDKLERAFQKYRIKVTGVQASDKELARLRPLIFNLSQSPEVFLNNADDILQELDQSASNRIGALRAGGRDKKVIGKFEKFYFGDQAPSNIAIEGPIGGGAFPDLDDAALDARIKELEAKE